MSKSKSNDVSKSEFEEHLEPLPDDSSEANADDTAEADIVDKYSPETRSAQPLLMTRWSSESPAIYKDMAEIRTYTFSMILDKLQLNFIGSRDLGCTVMIKCSSTIPMNPDDFIQITDGLGGQTVYSQFRKFNKYRRPTQNGTDIYVRYNGHNPSTRCTTRCRKKTDGYIQKLRSHPSFVSAIDSKCRCGEMKRTIQGKIVGGEEATPFEIPWQIALVNPGKRDSFCGASLINERYALTAAHCLYNDSRPAEALLHAHVLNQYRLPGLGLRQWQRIYSLFPVGVNEWEKYIFPWKCQLCLEGYNILPKNLDFLHTYFYHLKMVGRVLKYSAFWPTGTIIYAPRNESTKKTDADEQSLRLQVEEVINHPLYDNDLDDYDIALLRFKEKIDFSQHPGIKPICLESWNTQTDYYAEKMALVSGWGRLNYSIHLPPTTLQKVSVKMQNKDTCQKGYQTISYKITARMICAGYLDGGKDACTGDSGGPLSLKINNKWRQIGVVSTGEECATKNFLGIYSNIAEMRQWIQRMVHQDTKWCPE